jgi:large subunit ribosomal protein L29
MKKAETFQSKTKNELLKDLEDARQHLFRLRMQKAIGQLDNTVQLKETRHRIARILTVITQKERIHVE